VKILIASVRTGSGHVKAAEALQAAFQKLAPTVEAVHVDVIDWVKPAFRRLYLDGYRIAVNRAPKIWGGLYRFSDRKPSAMNVSRAQKRAAGPFFQHLKQFRPDLILATHFLVPQLLAASAGDFPSPPPVESVITDYEVHQFWVSGAVSRYYVAHEGMVPDLRRRGVPASHVMVTGIPVHPRFSESVLPSSIFRNLDIDPLKPVILMLAGGLGLNKLEEAVENLLSLPGNAQIVTVAGRNDALKKRLDALRTSSTVKLVNLGYVDNMHEILGISDIVITKPGGLTVSECLAKKKLMILISPIPGQEEKNAEFLIAREAALRAESLEELPRVVERLMADRSLRNRITMNVGACARPHAAFTIAQAILGRLSMAA